jgi:hypothetical protein
MSKRGWKVVDTAVVSFEQVVSRGYGGMAGLEALLREWSARGLKVTRREDFERMVFVYEARVWTTGDEEDAEGGFRAGSELPKGTKSSDGSLPSVLEAELAQSIAEAKKNSVISAGSVIIHPTQLPALTSLLGQSTPVMSKKQSALYASALRKAALKERSGA